MSEFHEIDLGYRIPSDVSGLEFRMTEEVTGDKAADCSVEFVVWNEKPGEEARYNRARLVFKFGGDAKLLNIAGEREDIPSMGFYIVKNSKWLEEVEGNKELRDEFYKHYCIVGHDMMIDVIARDYKFRLLK